MSWRDIGGVLEYDWGGMMFCFGDVFAARKSPVLVLLKWNFGHKAYIEKTLFGDKQSHNDQPHGFGELQFPQSENGKTTNEIWLTSMKHRYGKE
ncbi:CLUMA_CG008374, isoform A [Clunio marinus]|uniref:CLUMA_CG008374, isoform A n=1 Tax=Clunio marinus TaxID=568069 RepID=A0A1J1I552_9DIPT|nr:CLUMA_CG008374, isoform A [Clunio marinus]